MADPVFCANCGAQSQATSRYCARCGQSLFDELPQERPSVASSSADGGWRPAQQPAQKAIQQPAGRSNPLHSLTALRPKIVEGQARGMQVRSEPASFSSRSVTMWSFRVERYDQSGDRALLVPVEMRGIGFAGTISDGDWVRVSGKLRHGTMLASKIENLTTNSVVRPKHDVAVIVTQILIVIAVVSLVLFLILGTRRVHSRIGSEQPAARPVTAEEARELQ